MSEAPFVLTLIFLLLFLAGTALLQASKSAFRVLENTRSVDQLRAMKPFFVARGIFNTFSSLDKTIVKAPGLGGFKALVFAMNCSHHLCLLGFAISATLWVTISFFIGQDPSIGPSIGWGVTWSLILLAASLWLADWLPRQLAIRWPMITLQITAPFASLYLLATSPISLIGLLLSRKSSVQQEQVKEPVEAVREKIIEMLQQAGTQSAADENERELLESAVELRDTRVKEIMIPRVDMVCLDHNTPIKEAAAIHQEKGFSRIPVYRDSADHMIGLSLHKDVADLYVSCEKEGNNEALNQPISVLLKPILFVPETSRVSQLLHEFRRQQTHLAIVVDEHGGTEGLVTIEDCLEEIVGEIADEFDLEEEERYQPQSGGWLVDARMNLHEIEELFHIKIPQEADYDTIGGYAFHRAGEIPAVGLQIVHDDFEIEIIESTERSVEKILLKPRKKN